MTDKPAAPSGSLRADSLGVGGVTFFVVSAAGPLIAMAAGVPIAMLLGNGAGVPGMFLLATVLLLIFAAGYTAMAHQVRAAGGFYAFAARGLGGHAACVTASIAIFSYTAIQTGLYGLFGSAAAALARELTAQSFPWWGFSLLALALIAVLGYRQVDLSAKVLSLLVIAEYLVVLLLDTAILRDPTSQLTAVAFTPAALASGSPEIGLLICFTAFIGFEATTLYAEEARNPARTIPLATYYSLLLIGGFYVFSSWCMVAAVGPARLLPVLQGLADPTTLLFELGRSRLGPNVVLTMRLLLLTSTFASMLAFHNSIARYLFALGREGVLPRRLARTHAVYSSPTGASVTQTSSAVTLVTISAILHFDPIAFLFSRVSSVGTLGVVGLMAIASAAVFSYFRSHPGHWVRTRLCPLLGAVGLTGVFVVACIHFDVLAGGLSRWIQWTPLVILLFAVAGVVAAERVRRTDPARFRELGRERL